MFAERVKQLRLAQNLNKAQLARSVGVSDVTVSYWESGQVKTVGHDNLLGLSRTFNLLASEIIDDPLLPNYRADIAKKAIEAASEGDGAKFAPVEAIHFSLSLDDPKPFLAAWQACEWDLISEKWPTAPEAIYPGYWLSDASSD